MKARAQWVERMKFNGEAGAGKIVLDAKGPLGEASGMTPKELVALGIAGCTGMDVVALLKKYKQPLEALEVLTDVQQTEGVHPAVFKDVLVTFDAKGAIDGAQLLEAVRLSQTKFCGVSAMIAKGAPIRYVVRLNGEQIGTGQAAF